MRQGSNSEGTGGSKDASKRGTCSGETEELMVRRFKGSKEASRRLADSSTAKRWQPRDSFFDDGTEGMKCRKCSGTRMGTAYVGIVKDIILSMLL